MASPQPTAQKTEERVYTIPLRHVFQAAPTYKQSARAIHAVKEFLAAHMKAPPTVIKLSASINNEIFANGTRHPPPRIKVRTWKEDNKILAELASLPKPSPAPEEKEQKNEAADATPVIKEAAPEESTTEKKLEEEKKEVLEHTPQERKKKPAEEQPLKQTPPKEAKLDRQEDIFPKSQKPAHEKKKVGH